jgi:hypothetical protein
MISRKALADRPNKKKTTKKKSYPSLQDTADAIKKRKKRNQDALKGKFTKTKSRRRSRTKKA